ncbi:hypothetical protein [Streptomyces sp. NPDC057052]|uniref:hypothetical protein n=1 Tax=Streptomyces sp. NPDC057052 TaxID=3346010 RepID=UPI003642F155
MGVRAGVTVLALAALASGCAPGGTGADGTGSRPAPGQQPLQGQPARALHALE